MPFPYFSLTAKKVSYPTYALATGVSAFSARKEALSTASIPMAIGYLHYSFFSSKNAKLALLKQ